MSSAQSAGVHEEVLHDDPRRFARTPFIARRDVMRALVTGAARGIGLAIADALAAAGSDVIRCDIEPCRGDERALDVSDASAVHRFVNEVGPIDVLVNNAGAVRRTSPTDAWDKAIEDYDAVVDTNLRGTYLMGRAVIPGMVARGGAEILNVVTDHVHTCGWPTALDHADATTCPYAAAPRPPGGGPSMDVYDASKWGVVGVTLSWAEALRPVGIRVNALCVGAVDTAMIRSFLRGEPDPALVASWLRPEQVAAVVLALLDEGSGGRTGDCIGVWPGPPVTLPPPGRFAAAVPSPA